MALVRLWMLWGILPRSVIGHSLGHYAALNSAGVLSEVDTIYLVGTRAQLLQQNCQPGTHSMLAVRASSSAVVPFLKADVGIAAINGPDDVVLAGSLVGIDSTLSLLESARIKATKLNIPYGFHSSQIDCLLEEFEAVCQGVTFRSPSMPIICPLTKTVIERNGSFGPRHLTRHFRERVDMVGALLSAKDQGLIDEKTIFLEIGHHPNLSGPLTSTLGKLCTVLPSLGRNLAVWKALTNALSTFYIAGIEINWKEYHRDFISFQKVLALPAYHWDLKDYWIKYINDWSLRKGDPLPPDSSSGTAHSGYPNILSTTIHSVIMEDVNETHASISVESDLSRSDIRLIVQGHRVNGIPLCTPVRTTTKI